MRAPRVHFFRNVLKAGKCADPFMRTGLADCKVLRDFPEEGAQLLVGFDAEFRGCIERTHLISPFVLQAPTIRAFLAPDPHTRHSKGPPWTADWFGTKEERRGARDQAIRK